MGKKDRGDSKEIVDGILKLKNSKRNKSGIQGKVVIRVSKSSGTYGWRKNLMTKQLSFGNYLKSCPGRAIHMVGNLWSWRSFPTTPWIWLL